jgi:carboxypeptidase Taq
VIHETGHALYEQGLPEKYYGTPFCESASLGIHESQSRFWENHVGKSLAFASFLLPLLKKSFPGELSGINERHFYEALNKSGPTPIRTESDELTYNMHIVVRYELEKAFMSGDIKVGELPALWNEKLKTYLGIVPKNDAEGVLQDTHWSQGMIGYFPTYLLGNLYAAGWHHFMKKDIPSFDQKVASGKFNDILGWLRINLHAHGRKYTASELVKKITRRPLDASYFLEYLGKKFGDIYGF